MDMDTASCKGKHEDLWFPPFKEERDLAESHYYEIGKMVCATCPIREKCALLGAEEEFGLWGGTTPKERMSGTTVPPKRTLSTRYLHLIPAHTPGIRLDLPAVKLAIRGYAEQVNL